MTTKTKTVARIHEAPTGRWYLTNDAMNYLNESGRSYKSEREAIKAARESGEYTHRVGPGGKVVKL